jgi:L-ascorbate metabolism protein UlaG (beta-lactamase superfamily)
MVNDASGWASRWSTTLFQAWTNNRLFTCREDIMTQDSIAPARREFLKHASLVSLGLCLAPPLVFAQAGTTLKIQRLNWSGMRFVSGKTTLLIDPVVTDIWGGDSPYPLIELEASEGRTYALITHTHGDHFDTPGLKRLLGERGRVICDAGMAAYIAPQGLKVISVERFQPAQRGDFTVVPLPAVDGLGGAQVSWVVSVGGRRYIHCGDTIWHGSWRKWAEVYGPFDAAFLPINGARQEDGRHSEIPLSLTPEQAVDAALQLGARRLVPIHYGYHVPGSYEEYPNAMETLQTTAKRRGVTVEVLVPGDWLDPVAS